MAPWIYPPGTRRLLPQGAPIEISLHYVTSGTPQTDLPRIGFYLARDNRPLEIQSIGIGWGVDGFGVYPAILPYAREDVRTSTYTFANDAYLYELLPHMHLRGSWMTFEAIYPGGATELLLSVPHFHAHWLRDYRFAQPKRMPSGTAIRITGAFDNSAQNKENPAPSAVVNWGLQLEDEMLYGGIQFAETLTIRTHPQSRNLARSGTVTFSTSVFSPNPPIRYQWRLNGVNISGATAANFTITNAQSVHEGNYTVAISDSAETILSQPAILVVGDPPVITQPPVAQTVTVGSNATFTVTVSGTPPFGFQWRKGSNPLTNIVQTGFSSTFTLFNVRTNDAGNYRVVVTNAFKTTGVASPLVPLTVTAP